VRHNDGASPEVVAGLAAKSFRELVERAETMFAANDHFPIPLLEDLLDGMTSVAANRQGKRCRCGAPVDMTGRTYEMKCWRCFLDDKAANQSRRRVERGRVGHDPSTR
jgi:hypothetical protein